MVQADLWPLSDLARGGAGNGGVGTQGAVAPPDWGQAGPGGERGAVAAAAIVAVEKVVRSCGTIANHCCMCWQGCGWCAAVGGRWAHAKTWRLWRLRMEEQRLCGSLPGYGSSVGCGTTVGGDTIPGPGGSCSGGALAQLDLALAVDFVKWRSRPHLSCAAWRSRPRSGCHCLPRGAHAAAQVLHVCDQYHIRHCCRTQKVGGKARLMVRASWRRRWLQQWWRQAQRM